ncbi:MAG: ATP-binding protein [Verrucomicrobia bacterium]|nr:ATP-binding protein [Verrucomicrobiota bacterium]
MARIRYMERNVGLPVKAAVIGVLTYFLFLSRWVEEVTAPAGQTADIPPQIELEVIPQFFLIYVVINAGVASMLLSMRQLPRTWIQWAVYCISVIDALFLAALMVVTGGADSVLYWIFLGLIVRNAVNNPVAAKQIILNVIVSFCYLLVGISDVITAHWREENWDEKLLQALEQSPPDDAAEPFLLRLFLLGLMTACCYGVQVLLDKQRLTETETREFTLRQQQLQATGRLAAEIAHQLKNPLGVINNAAFTLQRTVKEGKTITQQIQIIREEVERSDRIITELMGYARLTEGAVERLIVSDELERAIDRVFPTAARYDARIQRDYASALPPLMMQRSHLSEVFVNILQNAREAMNGKGNIRVTTRYGENYSVVVTIADDGPGIPADKLPMIFEPYFTTKERGTGLGLAIVKHNTEIYGGSVEVESEPGKGTQFTITLPAKTVVRIRK